MVGAALFTEWALEGEEQEKNGIMGGNKNSTFCRLRQTEWQTGNACLRCKHDSVALDPTLVGAFDIFRSSSARGESCCQRPVAI